MKSAPATPPVFVPTWQSADPEDELRAPKLRKGGLAVVETPLAPPPAPEPTAEEPPFGESPTETWDWAEPDHPRAEAPEMGDTARYSAPPLAAPSRAFPGAGSAPDWTSSVGARTPERSRRSVLLACLIGAIIAAVIVVLAFTFRPALKGETTPAPGAATETTTPG